MKCKFSPVPLSMYADVEKCGSRGGLMRTFTLNRAKTRHDKLMKELREVLQCFKFSHVRVSWVFLGVTMSRREVEDDDKS